MVDVIFQISLVVLIALVLFKTPHEGDSHDNESSKEERPD